MVVNSPATAFINKISNIPASKARTLSVHLDLNWLLDRLAIVKSLKAITFLHRACVNLEKTWPPDDYNSFDGYGMRMGEVSYTKLALLINPATPEYMVLLAFGPASGNDAGYPSETFLYMLARHTKNIVVIDLMLDGFKAWRDDDGQFDPRPWMPGILENLMQNPNCPDHIKFLISLED